MTPWVEDTAMMTIFIFITFKFVWKRWIWQLDPFRLFLGIDGFGAVGYIARDGIPQIEKHQLSFSINEIRMIADRNGFEICP